MVERESKAHALSNLADEKWWVERVERGIINKNKNKDTNTNTNANNANNANNNNNNNNNDDDDDNNNNNNSISTVALHLLECALLVHLI